MSIEIAIFASVIIGVVAGLMLENMRRRIEPEPAGPGVPKAAPLRLTGPVAARAGGGYSGSARATDSATELQLVSDAGFASKPLLSGREADVLGVVEAIAAEAGLGWRVVPQVRLIDIIASSDADANAAIGEHRIDMLIVSANRMPVAAVDYQPRGQLRDDSAGRAAVKREALRRAAIPFLEVRANEPLDALRAQILRLASPPAAARAVRLRGPAAPPKTAAKTAAKTPAKAAAKATARPATAKARATAPTAKVVKQPAAPPSVVVPAVVAPTAVAPAAVTSLASAVVPQTPLQAAAKPAPKPATKPAPHVTAKFTPAKVKAAPPAAGAGAAPQPIPAKPAARAAAKLPANTAAAPASKALPKDPPAEP